VAATIDEFFDELGRRGYVPALAKQSGSIRFDIIRDGQVDRWLLLIQRGNIRVSKENLAADCTLRADAGLMERIVTGRQNPLSAFLRGAAAATGNPEMLVHMRRLLPAPVRALPAPVSAASEPEEARDR
jgi:predicted lipid carrier protein YhbT